MKILVIGSGAREHAIIHQINQSSKAKQIFALPGNAGIANIATNVENIKINDHNQIIKFCQENQIDLVIIGPEQPLVDGLVDDLQANNIKVFGPSKQASRLEASKIFTKKICDQYNIPTAFYQEFDQVENALKFLKDNQDYPIVIKADGLAAGKGVIIAQDYHQASNEVKQIMDGKFGSAGNKIIIEEFLDGVEVSYFAICDGKNAQFFGSAGDHKKIGEGETGLNTGGMGTYSPSPFIDQKLQQEIFDQFIIPTLKAMSDLNSPFIGFLFAGIILTKKGPKLLEFNTRFGDPEAQVILPRLETDFIDIILAAINGNLDQIDIKFSNQKGVCVIIASKGYPENYQKNQPINLPSKIADNQLIFHAGTKMIDGQILSNGGRVLAAVSFADNFELAINSAYQLVANIDYKDGYYRKDIGGNVLS